MSDDVQDPMAGDDADTDMTEEGEETAAPTEGGTIPPVPSEAPAGGEVAPAEGAETAGENAGGAGDDTAAADDAGDAAEE